MVASGGLVASNVAKRGPCRELAKAERRRFKRIPLSKAASVGGLFLLQPMPVVLIRLVVEREAVLFTKAATIVIEFIDKVEVVLAHRHVGDHSAQMFAQFRVPDIAS
jgi:hypothetical protein